MKSFKRYAAMIGAALTLCVVLSCLCLFDADTAFADDEQQEKIVDYTQWVFEKKVVPYSEKEHEYARKINEYFEYYGISRDGEGLIKVGGEDYFYNVVGRISSDKQNAPVVIIGASYDTGKDDNYTTLYTANYSYAEDPLHNYSAMVTFLELIKAVSQGEKPDYDVVFVAFGAELDFNAGVTAYVDSMPDALAKRVKLYLNLTSVAGGGDLYFYAGETEGEFSKAFRTALTDCGVNNADIPSDKYESIDVTAKTIDGKQYPYSHLALSGATAIMSQSGFYVANLVSGNWKTRSISNSESAVDLSASENLENVRALSDGIYAVLSSDDVMDKAFSDETQALKIDYASVNKEMKIYKYAEYGLKVLMIVAAVLLVFRLRKRKLDAADPEKQQQDNNERENAEDVFGGDTGHENERVSDTSENSDDDDVFGGF